MLDRFLVSCLRPLLRWGLVDALALSRREARSLLAAAWQRHHRAWLERPAERSVGGRVMARLAELTMALYEELRVRGLPEDEARQRTAAVTWYAYDRLCRLPWWLSRVFRRDGLARVKLLMGWAMRWFPYRQPDYQMEFVPTAADTMGFDVVRCPVALRFEARGLSVLCTASFCDLDYPLADQWRVELLRETTLAKGSERCAFRYRLPVADPPCAASSTGSFQ